VDTAIPCGLIVNELMTNALKYAFPNHSPGTINVSLTSIAEPGFPPHYELRVEDNGVGLPEGFDINSTTTLGLQLVTILITQLKGQINIISDNGTHFIISFSELNANHTVAKERHGDN